jgi:hypothetical protein
MDGESGIEGSKEGLEMVDGAGEAHSGDVFCEPSLISNAGGALESSARRRWGSMVRKRPRSRSRGDFRHIYIPSSACVSATGVAGHVPPLRLPASVLPSPSPPLCARHTSRRMGLRLPTSPSFLSTALPLARLRSSDSPDSLHERLPRHSPPY